MRPAWGASTIVALGMSPNAALAEARSFKLARTSQAAALRPYRSVSCGLSNLSGDSSRMCAAASSTSKATPIIQSAAACSCSKGANLLDNVHSPNRVLHPEVREPGTKEWKRISWDYVLTRMAKHLKADPRRELPGQERQGADHQPPEHHRLAVITLLFQRSELPLCEDWACSGDGCPGHARPIYAPAVASLAPSFGRGSMTNHWNDIKNADVILIMGGNAAVAHPVGFKYATQAMENRGAKLAVVDPRFTQSAAVADLDVPLPRSADVADIAFLGGIINVPGRRTTRCMPSTSRPTQDEQRAVPTGG